MLAHTELLLDLGTALAVGLLIGTERGWSARDTEESQLAAGIRTFGLVGLLGGLAALLASHLGIGAWIAMLVLVGLHALAGYIGDQRRNGDLGMTSEIALLLTFLLGSLALVETRALAAGCAVVDGVTVIVGVIDGVKVVPLIPPLAVFQVGLLTNVPFTPPATEL